MNIPDEFQKIGILLAQDRLLAVLKQVPVSSVSAIELAGVPGQNPSHDRGERRLAGPKKEMKVVGQERPRIAGRLGLPKNRPEPPKECLVVRPGEEDPAPLYSPGDDVVNGPWSVDPCLSRHARQYIKNEGKSIDT